MTHIEQLKKNLEDIAYGRGITIADIEDGCNLRHGYIARMGNNQKGTIPLEVAIAFAKFTDYTIDQLINSDFSYMVKERDIANKKAEIERLTAEVKELEGE